MISLQTLSKEIVQVDQEGLSKKRKWDDPTQEINGKLDKFKTIKPDFDANLKNDTPLPLEWQRCLDIKSGQIYFFNTRTQKRALGDPRSIQEPHSNSHHQAPTMSLELELNLPCQSLNKNDQVQENNNNYMYDDHHQLITKSENNVSGLGLTRSPSWLTFEGGEQQEMVTAVCKKCYMLVMMCKSLPSCPNCKFVHPSEPNSNMFNQRLSLLC